MVGEEREQQVTSEPAAEAVAEAGAQQEPISAGEAGPEVIPAARWRAFAERQNRAFHVLVLTCVIFGLAAAAFAWTTIRVHDRQATAENRERDVARVLAAADVRSVTRSTADGAVSAYYSPKLGRAVIVMRAPQPPAGDHTYEFWYVDAAGSARSAGTSRFDKPRNDLVLAAVPAGAQLEVTVEPSGGSAHPTTPALAVLPLG